MTISRMLPLFAILAILWAWAAAPAAADAAVVTPRIHHVEMLEPQPWKSDDAVIWYDPWDEPSDQYFEQKGPLTDKEAFGGKGKSLEVFYPKGKGGGGSANRKLGIGDSPVGRGKAVKKGKKFQEVFWRMYVKHQRGWTGGGPAKMSRVTIFNASNWSQAMISHVWAGGGDRLSLDPVRAARGTSCTTSKYNDWGGLKWICNSPASQFRLHSTEESGRWVCVEAQAKLNTPGKSDGYNALWIDGIKQCERRKLDFRSSYTKYGINAVLIEAYWNKGSPVDQYRYYDDLVVSTKPIGPAVTPLNPVLVKTAYEGDGKQGAWEVEVAVRSEAGTVTIAKAEDCGNKWNPIIGEDIKGDVVWKSKPVTGDGVKVTVGAATGSFGGERAGKSCLEPKKLHFCRVRQKSADGTWSAWSGWHQGFATGDLPDAGGPATPGANATGGADATGGGGGGGGDPLAAFATRIRIPRELARSHDYEPAAKGVQSALRDAGGDSKKALMKLLEGYEAGGRLKAEIVKSGAAKNPRIYVDFAGRPQRARLASASAAGVRAKIRGMEVTIKWSKITPERFYGIARKVSDNHKDLADWCAAAGLADQAAAERLRVAR